MYTLLMVPMTKQPTASTGKLNQSWLRSSAAPV